MSSVTRFLNSISTKVLIILAVLFSLIIALVIYLINTQGYPKIKAESERVIQASGENAIDQITSNVISSERIARQAYDLASVAARNEPTWEKSLRTILSDDKKPLVAAMAYWPDKKVLDPNKDEAGITLLLTEKGYTRIPSTPNYLQMPWYTNMSSYPAGKCIWGQAVASTIVVGSFLSSCGMPVRDENGNFLGAITVSSSLEKIGDTVRDVQKQTGGYVMLIDASNQIIATSDDRVPTIKDGAQTPLLFADYLKTNPGLQPVFNKVNAERTRIIEKTKPLIDKVMLENIYKYDKLLKLQPDTSVMGYNAAFLNEQKNIFIAQTHNSFTDKIAISDDSVLSSDAEAYIFTEPTTLWKLVIVKPNGEINAIANKFRDSLLSWLLGSLLLTALLTYVFLNTSVLRPIRKTSKSMVSAGNLINDRQYQELGGIRLSGKRKDEIGFLNGSINTLLERVESNEGELAKINLELENKVAERTKDLEKALTDLKSSQVQLIRSEKMATLGQMVAGVAHEVNTPLTYIQGNLDVINMLVGQYTDLSDKVSSLNMAFQSGNASDEEIQAYVADILQTNKELSEEEVVQELDQIISDSLFGIDQISEMVVNLKDFARLDESKVKEVDMKDCVESCMRIAKNSLKGHKVVTKFDPTPKVVCSPSQINQVLINILNNASQAIPDDRDGKIAIHTHANQNYVMIDVTDNGMGMSDETIKKIFEPFFTTKVQGEGTGLGMAISQQIVEQHGGRLDVVSKVNLGTKFRVSLPIKSKLTN